MSVQELERLLPGKEMPSFEFLLRISKITHTPLQNFLTANYFGRAVFWKENDLRFLLLRLIKPVSQIHRIQDFDKFLGKVVYETAKNIVELEEFVTSNKDVDGLSKIDSRTFKHELGHQHYKLIEQVVSDYEFKRLTKIEEIITRWFQMNSQFLTRIFIAAIKEIRVKVNDMPSIVFHFNYEIDRKEIYGRTYDEQKAKMFFLQEGFLLRNNV